MIAGDHHSPPGGCAVDKCLPDEETQISADRLRFIQREISVRHLRNSLFPASLFADPAWDILIDLYASEGIGRPVSSGDACLVTGVSQSTGLRAIRRLSDVGLICRVRHTRDNRKLYLILTASGRRAMNAWIDAQHPAGHL